jgi:hypothetical protein
MFSGKEMLNVSETTFSTFLILTIFLGYVAIKALNIIANEEILHPIGIPLLVGTILFFLTLGIAQSEHTDAKVAETTPTK